MSGETQAVEDYLRASRDAGSWRSLNAEQGQLLRKSFAAQLARSATARIDDRRTRAIVKAEVYGHLVPLLDRHWQEIRNLHRFYRRLLTGFGAGLILSLILLAFLLAA